MMMMMVVVDGWPPVKTIDLRKKIVGKI